MGWIIWTITCLCLMNAMAQGLANEQIDVVPLALCALACLLAGFRRERR